MATKNSDVFGPAYWEVIHTASYLASENKDYESFYILFDQLIKHFPCETCREHATEYKTKNKPSDNLVFEYLGRNLGLFRYTFMFHNWVNREIGKPMLKFYDILAKYDKLLGPEKPKCAACDAVKKAVDGGIGSIKESIEAETKNQAKGQEDAPDILLLPGAIAITRDYLGRKLETPQIIPDHLPPPLDPSIVTPEEKTFRLPLNLVDLKEKESDVAFTPIKYTL